MKDATEKTRIYGSFFQINKDDFLRVISFQTTTTTTTIAEHQLMLKHVKGI
jgi:hypothetical protein